MKARTNVSINKELLEKARKYDLNVSSFLDLKLREYFALIEGGVFGSTFSEKKGECGRRESNPSRGLGRP